jgi:elongation factor Ts
VLVEINCETDFVARNEDFVNLTKEVMLQVAAMNPRYVSREDVPSDLVDKEREIRRAAAIESGKPEKVVDRIVEGQISKWLMEICLLEQSWVKDDKKTVEGLVKETVAALGENIRIRRFVRWEVGEGLEKRSDNFAEEVAKQAGMS